SASPTIPSAVSPNCCRGTCQATQKPRQPDRQTPRHRTLTTDEAAIGHHPAWHVGQSLEQGHRLRQFMGLPRCELESHSPASSISDHAGLGPVAATRAAKCLTRVPLLRCRALFAAPAAFWWARMEVPSRKTMPSATPRCCAITSIRSHTPRRDQRMNICAAIHHGPSSAGMARDLAPLSCRHRMALMVRRRCCGGTLAGGRQASTSGSSTAHCSSVSTSAPSKTGPNANGIQALKR
ncbi:hypothetical protein SAMN02927895_05742, partial [Belnapia rosea]